MDRFEGEYEDPMAEFKLIKQQGTVKEYMKEFDRIMARLNILPEHAISGFITGLKPEIGFAVKSHRPFTLPQAYQLARNIESQIIIGSKKEPAVSFNREKSRRLTRVEISEKRQKGLCFFCDKKFVLGHKCVTSNRLHLLKVDEDYEVVVVDDCKDPEPEPGEELEAEKEICEISLQALQGVTGYQTMRVIGSTHNFMEEELVKKWGIVSQTVSLQLINMADGGIRQTMEACKGFNWLMGGTSFEYNFLLIPLGSCNIILGVQWLKPLGDLLMNFQTLTTKFQYQGRECTLTGIMEKTKIVEPKKLDKFVDDRAQLFMTNVSSKIEEVVNDSETPVEIVKLIKEYDQFFVDPKGLPPTRGSFDHRIPLVNNSHPVNLRPYRYSSKQKDIIEKLVQELLDQGIVQTNYSPYASPVVLMGKRYGSWRLYVDYRALNKATVKDKFPIPIIKESLEELGGSSIYSKIHLRSVLAMPVSSLQFIVETNACDLGVGVVLMQEGNPIVFISKGLSGKYLTLSVYDKELLALVLAITKWSQYLMGRSFVVRTDQRALKIPFRSEAAHYPSNEMGGKAHTI
ncbi:uncharacterized protein LOC124886656 [Capsicum annuum]|uniref:uncharacterized protein LOC124886656 n=1 Tax=Capsicum annuum TaxID=4072 RepID=UPI001FB1759D|nr:uncharacterized protein LOC124886656 [Capsicum annuum]